MADSTNISVFGQEAYFNENARFYKDVYIYGTLYAEGNIKFTGDKAEFDNNVVINDTLDVNYLRVLKRLDAGADGKTLRVDVENNKVGVGSESPQQTLDVGGSIKIASQIYDSDNNPGVVGAFLTKDNDGIKWTPFEPTFSEGIFVYNDETLVGVQSFRGLNLKTGRGSGINTDPIQGVVNPNNPFIADIYVYEYWDYQNGTTNIYRNSNVGINTSNPTVALDIVGTVKISNILDVSGATTLNSTLDVDGITTLNNTLDVDGATTLNSTLDVDGITTLNNALDVDGATTLNSSLNVTGVSTFNGLVDANNGATINNIRIGIADDNTIDTSTGTLILNSSAGAVTIGANQLTVTGIASFNDNANFDKNLIVTGISTFVGIVTNRSTIFGTQLSVSGVSTFNGLIDGNA